MKVYNTCINFGIKIPSGYGNNDGTLLAVSFYSDTLCEWQLIFKTPVF